MGYSLRKEDEEQNHLEKVRYNLTEEEFALISNAVVLILERFPNNLTAAAAESIIVQSVYWGTGSYREALGLLETAKQTCLECWKNSGGKRDNDE